MDIPTIPDAPDTAGELQQLIDAVFAYDVLVSQLDLVLAAENYDFGEEVMEVVGLLPPGSYLRHEMCDQLNSIITAHGWGIRLGTVG